MQRVPTWSVFLIGLAVLLSGAGMAASVIDVPVGTVTLATSDPLGMVKISSERGGEYAEPVTADCVPA